MTLRELKKASGMKCSIASLSRKLAGKHRLSEADIDRIARALGVAVKVTRTTTTITIGDAA